MKFSRYNIYSQTASGKTAIYNGVSGGVLLLSAGTWQDAQNFESNSVPTAPELIAKLIVGGMIVSESYDELQFLEQRYDEDRTASSHIGITIAASLGCNFACPYCFEEKHPRNLTPETIEALIEHLRNKAASGTRSLHVTWFGGEPLMALSGIEDFSARLETEILPLGVEYSADIITNGYSMTRDVAARLKAIHVASAQVGIDGPPAIHDRMRPLASGRPTFERILENIQASADLLEITVRVNVARENSSNFVEVCELLDEAGLAGKVTVYPGRVTHVATNPASPSAFFSLDDVLSASEFAQFELRANRSALLLEPTVDTKPLPQPVASPCTAVRTEDLVVGPDGTLWKCWNSVGDYSASFGNLLSGRRNDTNLRFWEDFSPFQDQQCRSCIALPVCMGGCAHESLNSSRREDQCSTFRRNHQERVDEFSRALEPLEG